MKITRIPKRINRLIIAIAAHTHLWVWAATMQPNYYGINLFEELEFDLSEIIDSKLQLSLCGNSISLRIQLPFYRLSSALVDTYILYADNKCFFLNLLCVLVYTP